MDLAARIHRSATHRSARLVRRRRAARGRRVDVFPLELQSTVGYRLAAHVHRPGGEPGRLPAVVLCPGTVDSGSVFTSWLAPLHADEVARLGFVVLRFDPAGRGESWGEEDMGGPEHADDVATMLRYLAERDDVDPARIGVVAISFGVSMAVGGVHASDVPVAWLLDWEGPSEREVITAGETRMAPAMGHAMDDEGYWRPREAVRHVGTLPCGYMRLQAETDHAQPGELRHAQRMVFAAAQGHRAGTLPWFQLNDHPRNVAPPRPLWVPDGPLAANRVLLRKLDTLRKERAIAD